MNEEVAIRSSKMWSRAKAPAGKSAHGLLPPRTVQIEQTEYQFHKRSFDSGASLTPLLFD